jgi:xanthine dehydrogenase YagT iron-sulfur-binding subunit
MIGSAVATAGLIVTPLLGDAARQNAAATQQADPNAIPVSLDVNGAVHTLTLDPRTTLLDALREHLDITGPKKGCDQGACGACTVLVDGRRINSCLTLAAMNAGKKIVTVEGLANEGPLQAVQAAFIRKDGFQCGYCTPGQICSAVALIREGHTGSAEEIREWMSGNVCRCGCYMGIVEAVKESSGV